MKKIIVFLLLIFMIISIIGCNNTDDTNTTNDEQGQNSGIIDDTSSDNDTTENEEELVELDLPSEFEIIFSSERDGDRDLYMMNGDGSSCRSILDLDSFEGHPDWSPDGKHVVFFSTMSGGRQLFTINVDSDQEDLELTQLTDSTGQNHLPDWSPDGSKIAFESIRDGNSEIYIMNADGTEQIRLTNNSQTDKAPSFSPDGTTIGYTSTVDGIQKLCTIQLSDIGGDEEYPPVTVVDVNSVGYIDWSADGKSVAYHTGGRELYMMSIATGEVQTIVKDESRTVWIPVFSPDEKWIVYDREASFGTGNIGIMHVETGQTYEITATPKADWGPDWRPVEPKIISFDSDIDGDREIYTMLTNGQNLSKLTDNDAQDGLASWSPDGSRLVFFSDRDGDDELYIMDADGSNVVQLTFNEAMDRAASWSHDGRRIAFVSDRTGNEEIFVINSDGTNEKQLTDNLVKDFWPAWSLDDRYITYTMFNATQDTYKIEVPEDDDDTIPIPELLMENCNRCEYSPDGTLIAFSSKIGAVNNIYIMNEDGTNPKEIAADTAHHEWVPTWSNDGKHLLYSMEMGGGRAQIVMVDIDTGSQTIVIPNNAQNWRPLMKPDNVEGE